MRSYVYKIFFVGVWIFGWNEVALAEPAMFVFSPSSVEFSGTVRGLPSETKVSISRAKIGENPTITDISVIGENAIDFKASEECLNKTIVDKSCVITVTFKPNEIGEREATLVLFNENGLPSFAQLKGKGINLQDALNNVEPDPGRFNPQFPSSPTSPIPAPDPTASPTPTPAVPPEPTPPIVDSGARSPEAVPTPPEDQPAPTDDVGARGQGVSGGCSLMR